MINIVENNIIAWLNISFRIKMITFNHYLTKNSNKMTKNVTIYSECNIFVKNLCLFELK